MNKSISLTGVWLLAAVALLVDQLSKWAILVPLDLPATGRMEVIPGFLNFVFVWNKGINFGLLASDSWVGQGIVIAIAIAVSAVLTWWNRGGGPLFRAGGSALMIGGALSNAVDRVVHGAVVDFLNVSVPGIHNPFSFNIADIWVFLGAALIIFGDWRDGKAKDG